MQGGIEGGNVFDCSAKNKEEKKWKTVNFCVSAYFYLVWSQLFFVIVFM